MSISSGRKTSKTIIFNAIKSFLKFPSFEGWGISIRDFEKWKKIFLSVGKDSEILRNAQFILQQRIFLTLSKLGSICLSFLQTMLRPACIGIFII